MMPEHKYITERFERRTYIKGTFKGKFVGRLDAGKSDEKHERFYDLEILEGDIFTTQQQISKWQDKQEPVEFIKVSSFLTRMPGEMRVALQYLDGSVRYFKIRLQELKLLDCVLSRQIPVGKEIYGTIEGSVSGYILHYDTTVEEIGAEEIKLKPIDVAPTPPEPARQDKKVAQWRGMDYLKRGLSYTNLANRSLYDSGQRYGCLRVFTLIFVMSLLIGLVVIFKHLTLILLFLFIGLLLIPRIYGWLSRRFNLRLSVAAFTLICLVLFLAALSLLIGYYKADKQEALVSEKAHSKKQQNFLAQQKAVMQYKDSFNYYLESGKQLGLQHHYDTALKSLARASAYALREDSHIVKNERVYTLISQAEELVIEEQYSSAIVVYTEIITLTQTNATVFYKRAKCYLAIQQIKDAVTDLKSAIELGDEPATILHDKINPLKKIFMGYLTRCCDGTTSNARGSGTCSGHKGVCDWDEPVYEMHRKYE